MTAKEEETVVPTATTEEEVVVPVAAEEEVLPKEVVKATVCDDDDTTADERDEEPPLAAGLRFPYRHTPYDKYWYRCPICNDDKEYGTRIEVIMHSSRFISNPHNAGRPDAVKLHRKIAWVD
ncbi:hypothetical protein PR202_ga22816 [Eleusine coracana subsp. coracana]|uniref:Uncharacterized protein n=1 Tax=Eleusine coracana subsp. coracana TaxID=191504 RepID=A0AAV5D3P4_ELECO|nr:hypothetical protein PR202_ga22816 [Eleusine coracana subsp. coracana]